MLFLACKKETATIPQEVILTDHLPSSFLSFFEKFHADSIFQMEHISFPLKGVTQNRETMLLDTVQWLKSDWIAHKPFNDHGGTFVRSFTNFNDIIIENISDTSKTFSMERRFAQLNNEWHLIYYSNIQQNAPMRQGS